MNQRTLTPGNRTHGRSRWPSWGLLLWPALLACDRQEAEESPAPPLVRENPWNEPLEPLEPGDPAAAQRQLEVARSHQDARRFEQADAAFAAAVAADPAHLGARLEYGFFLLGSTSKRSLGRALEMFRYARLLAPEHEPARWGEALARQALGDHVGARPILKQAVSSETLGEHPGEQVAVLRAWGVILHSEGKLKEARKFLREALRLCQDPKRGAAIRCDAAQAELDAGNPEAAETLLREAIADEPERLRAHYLLLRILEHRNDPEVKPQRRIHELLHQLQRLSRAEAESTLKERVALRRELADVFPYPGSRRRLIRDLLEAKFYPESLVEIQKEHQENSGFDAELLYLMARTQAGLGNLASAKKAADTMRQLNPRIPVQVLRDVIDEWRRAFPSADPATYEQLVRQWIGES